MQINLKKKEISRTMDALEEYRQKATIEEVTLWNECTIIIKKLNKVR